MITIVAKSLVKEGCVEKFVEIAQEHVRESRKEEGCISFNLYQDLKDKQIFTFIEEWENQGAIDKHNGTERIKALGPKMSEVRVEKAQINMFQCVETK